MDLIRYNNEFESEWDDFVLNKAINGTFLQTRKFLNYHQQKKLDDFSVLFRKKERIIAAVPACTVLENNRRTFFSHKGSTFGGIVISEDYYNAEKLLKLIQSLDNYLRDNNFNKSILKITSDTFSKMPLSLMEYCLFYHDYNESKELSAFIDYEKYDKIIESNFTQGKRTNLNNCNRNDMKCCRLTKDEELASFYQILCDNLVKFDTKPIHSLSELLEFKNSRLSKEVSFWGGYLGDELVTGSMMFHFNNCLCAHAQYLCAKQEYNKLSPMTFMYYKMIEIMREMGYKKLSWGIATENCGKVLNLGLIKAKESYGSKYSINRTFYKYIK